MQESHRESYQDESPSKGMAGIVAVALRWGGAALSVGLVLGIIYWSFQLGQRDAQEVPVIRAMAGQARVAPDSPGGAQADHQGLAVNEVLGDTASESVDTNTTLAPATQPLSDEDESMATLATAETTVPVEEMVHVDASAMLTEINPQPEPELEEPRHVAADGMVLPFERPEGHSGAGMVIDTPDTAPDVAPEVAPETGDAISDEIEGLLQEILPEEGGTSVFVPEPEHPAPAYGNPRLDPGSALVQLGAFNSVFDADAAWGRYQRNHGALFAGLQRFIEPVEAGGRMLFQLRAAGFNDLNETRSLCKTLIERGVDCISVTTN